MYGKILIYLCLSLLYLVLFWLLSSYIAHQGSLMGYCGSYTEGNWILVYILKKILFLLQMITLQVLNPSYNPNFAGTNHHLDYLTFHFQILFRLFQLMVGRGKGYIKDVIIFC